MNIETHDIIKWEVVDISNGGVDTGFDSLANNIVMFLDELLLTLHDDIQTLDVLIENQPVLKAPKMKSIQIIIYTYFKVIDIHSFKNTKPILVSAGKKNSYMKNSGYALKAKDYKSNKETSIKLVTDYLHKHNKNVDIEKLNSYKKKDDIADSLIQILAYYQL
jgi:hypothetical protein